MSLDNKYQAGLISQEDENSKSHDRGINRALSASKITSAPEMTPAKTIPSNFKNPDQFDFFEGANGHFFFRRKVSAKKEVDNKQSGLSKSAYANETALLPRRMNIDSGKKTQVVQSARRTPHKEISLSTEPRSKPLTASNYQGSSSDRKLSSKTNIHSSTKVPEVQARKGLLFSAKRNIPRRQNTLPPSPLKTKLPLAPITETASPSDDVFVPATRGMLLSPNEDSLNQLQQQVLDSRESLHWVSKLSRESVTFNELEKLMNDHDKKNINEDDTSSFEALEKRMRTPVKGHRITNVVEPTLDCTDNKENIPYNLKADHAPINQAENIVQQKESPRTNPVKENIELIEKIPSPKIYKKKYQLFGSSGGNEPCTSREKSLSLGCLKEVLLEEEKIVPLNRATSTIHVGTGESIVLSDLVTLEQAETVINDMDAQMAELKRLQEEQDQLEAKTKDIMNSIKERRAQFKLLWGVSPRNIGTMKTVFQPKAKEIEPVIDESVLVESNNTTCDETGIVPFPETPNVKKVRFNSGENKILTTSNNTTPTNQSYVSDQSFAALKTSFAFLATPLNAPLGSQSSVFASNSKRIEPTPLALRKLGDRVKKEWALLYAESEESSDEEENISRDVHAKLQF